MKKKQRELALLFLKKASEDEALLDVGIKNKKFTATASLLRALS